jgi:hypothetical protein
LPVNAKICYRRQPVADDHRQATDGGNSSSQPPGVTPDRTAI